jgi:hypothetical protein
MKQHLKNFLVEFKRRWSIIFETRELEIIRQDFYDKKWISKEETVRLMEYEIQQLTEWALKERKDKDIILENFNMSMMNAYYMAEEKTVKSGRLF